MSARSTPGPRVAYLGPPGTYSHEACLHRYGRAARLLAGDDFGAVLALLQAPASRRADVALLPVENSIEGPVTQSLDSLVRAAALTVTESFCLAIDHCLLARPGVAAREIVTLYSHPQALAQSAQWIRRHLPRASQVTTGSTAEAARLAAAEPRAAAIASAEAGRLHGLRPLARHVQDHAANTTRFMAVRRRTAGGRLLPQGRGDEQRALLHVVLPNRPGALLHALQPFQTANLNLTFIQSRPLVGRPWEYGFFIEVQVTGRESAFQAVLGFLSAFMEHSRLLGRYSFSRRPLR
jgi:chorismate mutase/prephenate dehydratase